MSRPRRIAARFSWGVLGAAALVCLCCILSPVAAWGETTGVVTMYRLYNASSGEHFYTLSTNEYETLGRIGWVKEGPAWVAPASSGTPVYRLYNPNSSDHHYTLNLNEYETLGRIGWVKEGVAWYSADAGSGTAVYRLFNPNVTVGTHHYTQSANEYNTLCSLGWKGEGIAWYGAATSDPYHGLSTRTPVMGSTTVSVDRMVSYYEGLGVNYPSETYAAYGAPSIRDFCTILVQEANAEGVRGEVLFAQVMHETGNLQFGGDVKPEQCNFGGIGATGGGNLGNSFNTYGEDSVRMGLRAQAQHLKAYASTEKLNNECVDPRFDLVTRGRAPYVENFGGGVWAAGNDYAVALLRIMGLL